MPQLYDDPAVKQTLPYAAQLLSAVQAATSRPVSPVYSQISQAVFSNVNKALGGEISPQDALAAGQKQIEKALTTF
jgi:multiple sugar transport system substrate-binding protein